MSEEVIKKARDFDRELCCAVDVIKARSYDNIKPGILTISTMSAISLLNADSIKLKRVVQRFDKEDVQDMIKKVFPDSYTVTLKRQDDVNAFSNAAILKFKSNRNTVAVKIFSNGILHITGPVSAGETIDVLELVCTLMDVIYQKEMGTFKVHDFYIQMINTNFSVQHMLDKEAVHSALRNRDMEAWIPEKHPAVSLKIRVEGRIGRNVKDKVTVLIFASGEVIITGVKSGKELLLAYETITDIVDQDLADIVAKGRVNKRRKVQKS